MKEFVWVPIILLLTSTLSLAGEIEEIAPFSEQRSELIPGEIFFKRNQYWTSSVLQSVDNTQYFTMSTTSTSLATNQNHNFFMSITGKQCNFFKVMIFIDSEALLSESHDKHGRIFFSNEKEYKFTFFVIKRKGHNIIGFNPINIDTLIKYMQSSEYMIIELPYLSKKIYYDLRGFSVAFRRASGMCNSVGLN